MNKLSVIAWLGGLSLLALGPATGDTEFHCGSKIISVGMSMEEVRQHCGEPTSARTEEQDVRAGPQVVGKTTIHVWTYESPTAYPRTLEFDRETLVTIR